MYIYIYIYIHFSYIACSQIQSFHMALESVRIRFGYLHMLHGYGLSLDSLWMFTFYYLHTCIYMYT